MTAPLLAALAALVALAAAGLPEQDDPRGRASAREQIAEERPSLEARWHLLQQAQKERARVGQRGRERVQGGAWVNLGPVDEAFGDNGARFTRVDSGRGRQLVLHPTDSSTFYLSTAGGGVWKTRDAGQRWEPLTDALGVLAVGALALDPAAPEILYLGFGDPFDEQAPGLVRSGDGGGTWSDPVLLQATYKGGQFLSGSVRDLAVDPGDSAHLFAGTDVGLFESHDAARTFAQVALPGPSGPAVASVWSIAWAGFGTFLVSGQLLADETRIQGANRNGRDGASPLGLWRTSDAGHSWTSVREGLPAGEADHISRATLALAPSTTLDPLTSRLYLLAAARVDDLADSHQRDVYRSEDAGQTWTPLGVNALGVPLNPNERQKDLDVMQQQAWYNQAIAVDAIDPDAVFVGGSEASLRSLDGGATWSVMTEGYAAYAVPLASVHPDFHGFAASAIPGQAHAIYAVNDGGLYRSPDAHFAADGKVTFSDALNRGLATHLVYDLACAADSWPAALQGFLIGGTQDNGTRLREGTTGTFDEVLGGDGVGVAVSREVADNNGSPAPRLLLASVGAGGMRIGKSSDGGKTFSDFTSGMAGEPPFLVRFARDADGQTFFTYTAPPDNAVYSTKGASWSALPSVVHLPSGATGAFVTSEGKVSALHALGAHPLRSGVLGAAGDAGTIYFSHDGGANWTMAEAVLGVDSRRAQGVKGTSSVAFPPDYDPSNPAAQTLYASSIATVLYDGTTPIPPGFGHAFKTTDGGKSWQPLLGSGARLLPDVPVEAVRVDPADAQTIYVATELGLYRSTDGGGSFDRLGAGLPLARVSEICFTGGALYAGTYGRGFWQLDVLASGNPAGVRGTGDANHDGKLDGLDLLDLAASLGASQADPRYRLEQDLVGATNQIDDDDLAALLARFGGAP